MILVTVRGLWLIFVLYAWDLLSINDLLELPDWALTEPIGKFVRSWCEGYGRGWVYWCLSVEFVCRACCL